jgi:2-amino-4-hydroxy-6-hydroxymethyldihydropteridine diphosphokinase
VPNAWLGIGTNMDDRAANMTRALREIGRAGRVLAVSRIYASAPVGYVEQDTFWNAAVHLSTSLPPRELLLRLKEIEAAMGRTPTFTNGPRLIDIDILFYDSVVLDEGGLQIPHPRALERAFVLRPLVEVAPELVDPVSGRRIMDVVPDVADQVAEPIA